MARQRHKIQGYDVLERDVETGAVVVKGGSTLEQAKKRKAEALKNKDRIDRLEEKVSQISSQLEDTLKALEKLTKKLTKKQEQ